MNLQIEVWALIFTYLRLIGLVEISSVCKTFYHICKKNIMLRNYVNQKIFLKKDPGSLKLTNNYLNVSTLVPIKK